MTKKLVLVCLSNFLIAALMGLLLRFTNLYPLNINFRFFTHAHSHIAMLGWAYLMLYLLFTHYFVPDKKPVYSRLFWVTQLSIWGMMFSFPVQGYAAVSIAFSTLHILCSYYFTFLIWRNFRSHSQRVATLLKASLVFMVISTFGVWCLGPAVGLYGKVSDFYQLAIQFFLHFQFNGWFLLATLGLFLYFLGLDHSKLFDRFFKLIILSTILSFGLPLHWFVPHWVFFMMSVVGTLLQAMAILTFLKLIKPAFSTAYTQGRKLEVFLYRFSITCLILKTGVQLLTLAPEFSQTIYQHRTLVIGFIHLLMLGIVSGFLFAFLVRSKLTTPSKTLSVGVFSFVLGFLMTELLLTVQGYYFLIGRPMLANYHLLLFIFSLFLVLGIALFLINIINYKKA